MKELKKAEIATRQMHWKGALQMTKDLGIRNISNKNSWLFQKLFERSPKLAEEGRITPHANPLMRTVAIPEYRGPGHPDYNNFDQDVVDDFKENKEYWVKLLGKEQREAEIKGIEISQENYARQDYFDNLIAEYAHIPEFWRTESLKNAPVSAARDIYRFVTGQELDHSRYDDPQHTEYHTHTGPDSFEEKLKEKYKIKQKGGIRKYQEPFDGVQLPTAESDATYVQQPQFNIPVAQEEQWIDKFGSPHGSHFPTKKMGWWKPITNTLANPTAAIGYSVRNEPIPWGNIRPDEKIDDMVLGLINPFKWGEYAGLGYEDLKAGNYLSAGLNFLAAAPGIPSVISGARHYLPKIITKVNKVKSTNVLKKELTKYNDQGLFNSIKEGGLSNKQINILSKNENLANTVTQNAVKNSDKVTAYRAVNVETALNNPTAVKALIKDGVDITNHSDVAKWLSTRVHTGAPTKGGLGYRAGGQGSEHYRFGDFAYTLPRQDLLKYNKIGAENKDWLFNLQHRLWSGNKKLLNSRNTAVSAQANQYGPWVNKLRLKGTDDLIDFSSGNRQSWVNRLNNYEPWKVEIKPYGMSNKIGGKVDKAIDNTPFLTKGKVPTIDPQNPFVSFDPNMRLNPALNSIHAPKNMFFGPRGAQIFESWGNPVLNPTKIGGGGKGNIIYKEGGHITSNLKRI
jgi:hypothetical protein